jgi:hypothetical protein
MSAVFPTSKDIYFEITDSNGVTKKVAVVQSYNTSYQKDDREVDAFGTSDPVGYTPGKKQHTIRISKAYITDAAIADGITFYFLDDFEFVIVKPDKRIVYSNCSITGIEEEGSLNDVIAENINIRSLKRREDKR